MSVTSTGVAVALAIVVALAFLFIGPGVLNPFGYLAPATSTSATQTDLSTASTASTTTSPALTSMPPLNQIPTQLTGQDLVVGTGATAAAGDTVTVQYVGALPDGTVFDASAQHGQPFTFTLGAGQVIKGWDVGVAGMKEGGTRLLIIPPSYGYGAQAVGPIPANSTLQFEVQLVSVKKGS